MPQTKHPTPASGSKPLTSPGVNINGSSGSNGNIGHGSVGNGIQTPAMQHKFIVRVEGTPQEFTQQSTAFAMNMVQKELMLMVEQSLTSPTREHIVIQDIINNPKRVITLEIMDGKGNVNDTIKFRDCVIHDHAVDFNYANSALVVHIMLLSYSQIDLGAGKAHAAFANAMSIVGKP